MYHYFFETSLNFVLYIRMLYKLVYWLALANRFDIKRKQKFLPEIGRESGRFRREWNTVTLTSFPFICSGWLNLTKIYERRSKRSDDKDRLTGNYKFGWLKGSACDGEKDLVCI